MIPEEKEDIAVEYALGMLSPSRERAFEGEIRNDEELRKLAAELCESAASLARLSPPLLPPPELRERVLSKARGELAVAAAVAAAIPGASTAPSKSQSSLSFIPWAIAAGLAITSAAFWVERGQWKNEALALRNEAAALRQRDAFSQMKIAMLTAQNEAYSKAAAVVVWDSAKQRGMLKLFHVPQAAAGKDYQLWLIDPKKPAPISGGVVSVNDEGFARVSFSPTEPVGKTDKFAISIERAGGAPKAAGPIILAGD